MAETLETSRGPDGRFTASTPPPPPAASPDAAPPPVQPSAAPETGERTAPSSSHRAEAKKEWDRLTGAQPATSDATGTSAAAPPATRETESKSEGGTTPPPSDSTQAPTPAADKPPAKEKEPYTEYAGTLDRKTGDLLKSVNMLIPPEQWKGMSRWDQDEHLAACKALRRQLQQQANNQGGQQNTGQQQSPAGRGDSPEFSGQQQPTQTPLDAALQRFPQDVQESMAQVAVDFGINSPVYQAQLRMAAHLQNALQQVQTGVQMTQAQQRADADARQFEDSVFGKFLDAAPSLRDPQKVEQIRQTARATYRAHRELGHEVDARQVIEHAVLGAVGPEIQQRETEKLEKKRQDSLASSVERGSPQSPDARAAGKPGLKEQRKEQFEKLRALQEKGIDGQAALMQLSA